MEEGFILEHIEHRRNVAEWIQGKPEISFWMGAKIDGRAQYQIRSYRCIACGFLESYAPE